MPQFDPSSFSTQLFWLALTFIGLYFLMAKVALPRIGAVLDERQRRIDDALEKAAQLKAEADAAIAAYEKALAESRSHAQSVIKETNDRIAKQSEERHKALAEKLAEQIASGEAKIAAAKDAALANVREVAADVAGAAIAKLLGGSADQAKVTAAISSAMEEVK